jgi:hypothetical protein
VPYRVGPVARNLAGTAVSSSAFKLRGHDRQKEEQLPFHVHTYRCIPTFLSKTGVPSLDVILKQKFISS